MVLIRADIIGGNILVDHGSLSSSFGSKEKGSIMNKLLISMHKFTIRFERHQVKLGKQAVQLIRYSCCNVGAVPDILNTGYITCNSKVCLSANMYKLIVKDSL